MSNKVENLLEEVVLCRDTDWYFIGMLNNGKLPSRNCNEPFFIKFLDIYTKNDIDNYINNLTIE